MGASNREFGGVLYKKDFNMEYTSMCYIAEKINTAEKFNERIKKQAECNEIFCEKNIEKSEL